MSIGIFFSGLFTGMLLGIILARQWVQEDDAEEIKDKPDLPLPPLKDPRKRTMWD